MTEAAQGPSRPRLTDQVLGVRLALLFSGGFLLYEGFQNWIRGRLETDPSVAVMVLALYAMAFVTMSLSMLQGDSVMKIQHLPIAALLFATFVSTYVIAVSAYRGVYRTDAMALTHYAAILFAENEVNPYLLDLRDALQVFPVQLDYLTFTASGDFVTQLHYPALHFLIFVPFVWLGLKDMRWVVLIFEVAAILTLYFKSLKELRPLLLLPLFAGSDLMINFTAGTVTDFLWVLPLVYTAFYMHAPLLAGASYGLAAAIKQEPWILAPFLLVYQWMRGTSGGIAGRAVRVGKFAGAALTAFLAPNIPFMMKGLDAWYAGVFGPIFGDLIAVSQGLSLVSQIGLVPLGKGFFSIASSAVLATLLVNYIVYFDKLRYIHWMFPGVILWFSFRGLQNYFIYWMPLLLASLSCWYRERSRGGGVE